MTEQPCPGPCNRRWREASEFYQKAVAAYDPLDPDQSRPEPPDFDPWLGDPVWCAEDAAKVSLHLAQLDTLAALLAAEADGHRDGPSDDGGKRGKSSAPPSPSPVADDLDELARMLADWEDAYRTIKGWPAAPPRGDLASRETERIAWLSRHLRGILASDIGPDFGSEVLQWHRGMARKTKAGVRTLRVPLRCPRCRMLALTWTEGSDRVECGNPDCTLIMTREKYDDEVAATAQRISAGDYDDYEEAS